ncbi:calcium/manganese antiporter SLC30A10 [Lepisosteus oculatus]|uniref:calcium/manganese antiporter SLC30A10 n=1 Tax=Lepisosteus oculatus TaxID=7918 RepID=UPI0035F513FF
MGRYSGKTCRLIFMLVLTFVFFVAEIVAGYLGNSIALVSDSFNMLSDLMSLCVGLTAARVSRRPSSGRCTYGLLRAEVVGALANAVFLGALCFSITVEAVKRLVSPERIDDPKLVLIVGALGLAVNIVGLLIFQDCGGCARRKRKRGSSAREKEDAHGGAGAPVLTGSTPDQEGNVKEDSQPLNIRGVLLHVLGDALGSVVVVVASAIFFALPLPPEAPCNWQCYVDPSLTIVMVIIILSSAAPLVKETGSILLQMVPQGLAVHGIADALDKLPGVQGVRELHIWELARGHNVATLHVSCADSQAFAGVSQRVRELFRAAGVRSVTIQPEFSGGAPCLPAEPSAACNGRLSASAEEAGSAAVPRAAGQRDAEAGGAEGGTGTSSCLESTQF